MQANKRVGRPVKYEKEEVKPVLITFQVEVETVEKLKKRALQEGKSLSKLLRELCEGAVGKPKGLRVQ
jgi:hypothetical protein